MEVEMRAYRALARRITQTADLLTVYPEIPAVLGLAALALALAIHFA
jgi:hypothetical protein